MNAVEVVGTYTDIRGSHGFLLSRGQYTSLDVPGASSTTALGINGRHEIVGTYWYGGMVRNYKYSQGTYTPVVDVCAIGHNHDSVRGINNAGMLVDQTCCNGLPTKTGFAFGPGVRANRLTVPGAKEAEVRGIDNSSPTPHMVGHYVDDHRRTRGALWNRLSDAPGRSYDFAPEAVRTMVTGINDAGQMVGEFETGVGPTTRDRGFMHGPGGDGTFVYPGAQDTRARGIDNPDVRGRFDVVGYFLPHWSDQRHGSSPPCRPWSAARLQRAVIGVGRAVSGAAPSLAALVDVSSGPR